MYTALIFFGGLSDVFMSLMLWFILDENKPQQFYLDDDRVYAVTDVIKERNSVNSEIVYEEDDEIHDISFISNDNRFSSEISKLMFDQFFTEVESPNHDWTDQTNPFEEIERYPLVIED